MNCSNCGKYTDTEATLCKECEQQEWDRMYPGWRNRMYGFGRALTSAIVTYVGYLLLCFSIMLIHKQEKLFLATFLIWVPLTVFGFVTGIISIRCFVNRRAPYVKPIATLVLGIVTICVASFAIIFGAYLGLNLLFA